MKQRPKRRLAAPLIATFAVLPACGATTPEESCKPPDCHMNPPPLPAVTQATATASVAAPEPRPMPTIPLMPPRNPPPPGHLPIGAASANLPAPTVIADVTRRSDGTCWEHVNVTCPQGVRCNPPPPHQVRCPADK